MTQEYLENGSGARNMDSGLQLQLEQDEGQYRAGRRQVFYGLCSSMINKA